MEQAAPPEMFDDSLLLAVIHSSNVPLLLLDGDLTVLAASDSFGRAFALNPTTVEGRMLEAVGAGEWNVPQLASLLTASVRGQAAIDAYEMTLQRPGQTGRQLIINARKLDHADAFKPRLLVTIMDVTDARIAEKLKDDLVREKGILLQELQHRVANSLQIIASVLMQSARRAQSEETRTNLHEAHQRIMSVAQLQQHLAVSRLGEVVLRTYFTDLCRSIGASMIRDHNQITLEVAVDESESTADVSISLGLIVTELVINALKHAFPGGRVGTIKVGYEAHEADWILSVTDDGIGMPRSQGATTRPGLGTNIVAALASSLQAQVRTTDAKPGISVAIVHQ